MQNEVSEAIKTLAAAIVKTNPEMRSSDKAYQSILFEFRERFLEARRAVAAAQPPVATTEAAE